MRIDTSGDCRPGVRGWGGGVFAVGSITLGGSLVADRELSLIVANVLNHFGH